mgnify:FL=1
MKEIDLHLKAITTFYTCDPKDSFFVNGKPPVETVEITAYDSSWAKIYAEVSSSIKNELGSVVQTIEHIGSTAIEGLAAKPWIDIDLTIDNPANEVKYVPILEKYHAYKQRVVREIYAKIFKHLGLID